MEIEMAKLQESVKVEILKLAIQAYNSGSRTEAAGKSIVAYANEFEKFVKS
jgi:hypothetical protein